MNNIEGLKPIPIREIKPKPPEKVPGKELIDSKNIGLQALLMAGCKGMPKDPDLLKTINTRLEEISAGERDIDTRNINKGSRWERKNYWDKEYKEKSFEERLKIWKDSVTSFVDKYKNKPEKKEIFKKLGINPDSKNVADEVYNTFIEDGRGDVGEFAKRIRKLEIKDIEDNGDIIRGLGGIYGEDSSEIADQLGKGLKNITEIDPEGFIKNSRKNIKLGDKMPGKELMDKLEVNIKKWDDSRGGGKPEEPGGGPTRRQKGAAIADAEKRKKKNKNIKDEENTGEELPENLNKGQEEEGGEEDDRKGGNIFTKVTTEEKPRQADERVKKEENLKKEKEVFPGKKRKSESAQETEREHGRKTESTKDKPKRKNIKEKDQPPEK